MRFFYILLCLFCSIIFNQQLNSQDVTPNIPSSYLEVDQYCLDAAFHLKKENKNYLFCKEVYSRLSDDKVDIGYPTNIQNGWKDLPEYWNKGIDAALRCESTKKTVFFKGREYFTIQNGHPVDKFPRKLPGEYENLPQYFHSNIDAAVYLPNNHSTYLFKGNQYVSIKNRKVEPGYPKRLPGEFTKLPKAFCSNLDAVLHQNGDTFFYKNGQSTKISKISDY